MTDEILDRLKSLADKIVLRDGDVEIAVIPLLLAEMDRLRDAAKDSADHYAAARAEIDRLRDDLRAQADWADWAKGEIDRLRNELKTETETVQHLISERTADREHWGAIEDSLNRAERILSALREPSKGVVDAMMNWLVWTDGPYQRNAVRAAVAAAEQEVGNV